MLWNGLLFLFGIFFKAISTVHTVCLLQKPCDDVDSFPQGDHFISFKRKKMTLMDSISLLPISIMFFAKTIVFKSKLMGQIMCQIMSIFDEAEGSDHDLVQTLICCRFHKITYLFSSVKICKYGILFQKLFRTTACDKQSFYGTNKISLVCSFALIKITQFAPYKISWLLVDVRWSDMVQIGWF